MLYVMSAESTRLGNNASVDRKLFPQYPLKTFATAVFTLAETLRICNFAKSLSNTEVDQCAEKISANTLRPSLLN